MREKGRPEDSEQKLEVWIGGSTFSPCIFAQVCRVTRAVRTMDFTVTVCPVGEHFVKNVDHPCGAGGSRIDGVSLRYVLTLHSQNHDEM